MTVRPTTIRDLLNFRSRLQSSSDSPALDVELLLCHCLQKDRSYLRAWPEAPVDREVEQQFTELLERRANGEPVAYLTGECGFWSLMLYTDASTLIPRPDTELLVEESLRLLADRPRAAVLDLGTGTGAVALALASERPGWQLLACDLQASAVALAERNRRRLGLDNVRVVESDWFRQIPPQTFDLIVSNPPYIDPDDPHLGRGDVRFEPRSALVAEDNGFADIERIISGAPAFLGGGGWLLFEHGYNQGEGARGRLDAAGYREVFTARDLAGHERVSGGRYFHE